MPNYQRECTSCGYTQESREKITSKRVILCPKCHHRSLVKLIGMGGGFNLKGGGFYKGGWVVGGKAADNRN